MTDDVMELLTFSAGIGGAVLFAHGAGMIFDTAVKPRLSSDARLGRTVGGTACIVVGAIIVLIAMRFKP